MQELFQQVVIGLASGSIYGLLALALVLIHRATGVINFAQGEMAMFSTYIAWQLVQWDVPYWLAFASTIVISFAGGLAIQRVVIRRDRERRTRQCSERLQRDASPCGRHGFWSGARAEIDRQQAGLA